MEHHEQLAPPAPAAPLSADELRAMRRSLTTGRLAMTRRSLLRPAAHPGRPPGPRHRPAGLRRLPLQLPPRGPG
ncbi:hypothetical protein ACWEQ8_31155, partial [Streptomyces noursei]